MNLRAGDVLTYSPFFKMDNGCHILVYIEEIKEIGCKAIVIDSNMDSDIGHTSVVPTRLFRDYEKVGFIKGVCTCGVDKVGGGLHSTWCDTN